MIKKFFGIQAFAFAVAVGWAVFAEAAPKTVHTYDLMPQVVAQIQNDGKVIWLSGSSSKPLLSGELFSGPSSRRESAPSPTTFVVTEGVTGGHRGFSASKDDDNDGAVNEDVLDGRDNDHDGRIDEDYAAISDGMVVVDFRQTGARAEYYHWSTPHLRGTTFMSIAGSSFYQFNLDDEIWREVSTLGEIGRASCRERV